MTTWNDIERVRCLDELCEKLGFTYQPDGYGTSHILLNATDELVVYAKHISLYRGNVEDMINFLKGWEQAHLYLNILGAINEKRIERSKLDYRNKHLVKIIKGKDDILC